MQYYANAIKYFLKGRFIHNDMKRFSKQSGKSKRQTNIYSMNPLTFSITELNYVSTSCLHSYICKYKEKCEEIVDNSDFFSGQQFGIG